MASNLFDKLEQAAGISSPASPTYKMPYGPKEFIKSGEVARPWTGPTPWRKNTAWQGVQDVLKNIGG